MNKVVVIFIEGDTEEEFYKELLKVLRMKAGGKFDCNVVVKNVKGVGNYKSKVGRIFEKKIKPDYPDSTFDIFLCYDTDVFELAKKPPIHWPDVIADLKRKGADNVKQVLAKRSIEDWFLYDFEAILVFLRLPKTTKISGSNGVSKLQNLFSRANKAYIKGQKCNGFIDSLNVEKILCDVCADINYICKALGVKCEKHK